MRAPFELLRESRFFAGFADADLLAFSRGAVRLSFSKGDRIVEEGRPAERLCILVSGTVQLSFRAPSEPNEMDPQVVDPRHSIVIHAVNEPGSLIGWSAMVEPYLCRATATALESTRMVAFDREFVEAYCQRRPRFGLEFMKRILWALGDRIGTSRAQLATRRYSREAQRVRELLARRGEKLGVNSPLYKLPIYLENRLTAADAYDTLDEVALSPNRIESDLAIECRRLIASAEREARVYRQLQRIYDTVAQAPRSASPHEIRRICCRAFQKLYALTSYRIRGWENLPDGPGNVILMNHLSNHVENTLPNRFQLTLDTHFVSAMILFERYGEPPVRVVRQAEPDEAGHRRYFNRFGYITVTSSRPRGPAEEVDRQLRGAREQFLRDARHELAAGRNLVICPEGGSTKTRSSPMAFRAGAFRIVRDANPEPLLVPIAVANFDKQIARTRLAAKIFPPIRLSEHVDPSASDSVFYGFINDLRERYRGYVHETCKLAG